MFRNPEVAQYMNQNYVSLKIDCETKEGKMLVRQFEVKSYPTLIFLDGNGKEKERSIGYLPSKIFLKKAKKNVFKI